jgi:osmotically-inducible protein OsmY
MRADVELQKHVLEELDWEPSIDAAQIGVTAHDGVVTLTGRVAAYSQKYTAEKVVKRVHGVKAITNQIEVQPSDAHQRDDVALAAAIVHRLEWDAGVPHDRLQVTVRNGCVTITGTVEAQHQRRAAERAVRHLQGVRGIHNEIRVAPVAAVDSFDNAIATALRRNALLRKRQIGLDFDQQNLILTGDVRTCAEREEAERIAWAAPGVRNVQNCITVTPWGSGPAEEWGY